MRRNLKRGLAGALAVMLMLPIASNLNKESEVNAATKSFTAISDVDSVKVCGEVAHYTLTKNTQYQECIDGPKYNMYDLCPTNHDYYIEYMWTKDDSENGFYGWNTVDTHGFQGSMGVREYLNNHPENIYNPDEGDAYRWILTNGQSADAEWNQLFYGHEKGGRTEYDSRDITLIDADTTVVLPLADSHTEDGWVTTSYGIGGWKQGEGWTILQNYDSLYITDDITYPLGNYINDGYDCFCVFISRYIYSYNDDYSSDATIGISIDRTFVPADKFEKYKDSYKGLDDFSFDLKIDEAFLENSRLADGGDGNWYLYTNGAFNPNYTGLFCDANVGWWLVVNGRVAFEYNDLYGDANYGWWKVTNGAVDFGYNDLFGSPTCGWWKVTNGAVDFGYSDLYGSPTYGWWLVNGGAVNFDYSDLFYSPQYGWWLVYGGAVNFGYSDLFGSPLYGWWKVNGGAVDFGYTGAYASPMFGPWNINGGAVVF